MKNENESIRRKLKGIEVDYLQLSNKHRMLTNKFDSLQTDKAT